jgi:hypothetical protein
MDPVPESNSKAKPISLPYNQVRNLDEVNAEMVAAGATVSQVRLDEELVPISKYKKADIDQVVKDWPRNLKRQIFINNRPLVHILDEIQITMLRDSLKDYLKNTKNRAERKKALKTLFPQFDNTNTLASISDKNLKHLIDNYSAIKPTFVGMAAKNDEIKNLLSVLDNGITKFFVEETPEEIKAEIWENIIRNHLLVGMPKPQQDQFVEFLQGYAHQGGFLYPAITTMTQAISDANKFERNDFKVSNDALYNQCTLELTMSNGQLYIHEKSSVDRIFHLNSDSDIVDDFSMEELNQDNKKYNIFEFDVTQVASVSQESKSESGDAVEIRLEHATVNVYKDQAWAFILEKMEIKKRSDLMISKLVEYADIYKLKLHDQTSADKIFQDFPEVMKISPIKTLNTLDKLGLTPWRQRHNEADSILAVLGRLKPEYAKDIVNNFNDYLAQGPQAFKNAMKLLHRLGESEALIRLLTPYTKGMPVESLTRQILPPTYNIIVQQYAEAKVLEFEKNDKGKEKFVQALQILVKTNKSRAIELLSPHAPQDVNYKDLLTAAGIEKVYDNIVAKNLEQKVVEVHKIIVNFREAYPTKEEFTKVMQTLQKANPAALVEILSPYKFAPDAELKTYQGIQKAYAGFIDLHEDVKQEDSPRHSPRA